MANNLNDISKDHPDLALDICERWYGHSERTDWIVKHACRGLLKAGNRRALNIFGFGDPADLKVSSLKLSERKLAVGDDMHFTFGLKVTGPEEPRVRLEYGIWFVKAKGQSSRKIFQIGEGTYAPGVHHFSRKHSFADRSTRTHYPGTHRISIIINGVEKAKASFDLQKP